MYKIDSIKNMTRQRRYTSLTKFSITGILQICHKVTTGKSFWTMANTKISRSKWWNLIYWSSVLEFQDLLLLLLLQGKKNILFPLLEIKLLHGSKADSDVIVCKDTDVLILMIWAYSNIQSYHKKLSMFLPQQNIVFEYILSKYCISFQMYPFSTPWKHQKSLRFSDAFRRQRKSVLETNGFMVEDREITRIKHPEADKSNKI